jgi:signal transduction histidine kinase
LIRLSDVSLKAKLVGLAALVTLVSLGTAFTFVVTRDIRVFRKDVEERTILIARVVGDYSAADVIFSDRKASHESLALLRSVPSIVYAAIYDSKGKLFSAYEQSPEIKAPQTPGSEGSMFAGSFLTVVQAVPLREEGNGWIRLVVSTEALQSRIRDHIAWSIVGLLVILGVAVVIALRLQRLISSPVLDLVATARRISRSPDYSVRVPKAGADEIGVLCDSFNEMLQQIERREVERDRADRRSHEKSLFLAQMSHELRTPLNSIIGFSDVLLDGPAAKLEPREQKFLRNINSAGRHLLRLINNILDLSKIEAGKMDLELSAFPLRRVVEDVMTAMRGITEPRNITIELEMPEGELELVADEVKVKQILYNLLSNAVKFSDVKARVWLSVRPVSTPEPSYEIAVRDEGIGISEENLRLIFQEFRQLDSGESRRFEGTGLGLSLVKRFAELHRGSVGVQSAPGKGSTFTVVLPQRARGVPRLSSGTGTKG